VICLTRINHVPVVINADLIEHIETTPDTVITLTTGRKFVVLESPEEIIRRIIAFRQSIRGNYPVVGAAHPNAQCPQEAGEDHGE